MKTREKTRKRKIWNPENRAPKQKRSRRDPQDDDTGSGISLSFKLRGESKLEQEVSRLPEKDLQQDDKTEHLSCLTIFR